MKTKIKKLPFRYSGGTEKVSIIVGEYSEENRLYVGLVSYEDGMPEMFADVTVNIPDYPLLSKTIGFISNDFTKEILAFIEKNKLGTVLDFTAHSGFVDFPAVEFDLDRLAEFDPDGVEEFRMSHAKN